MSSSWCTIESDPGVFTELIEGLGVKDTSVSEIYSFDMAEEWQKQGCQGFIYLFKYKREEDPRPVVDAPEGMFFARQVVQDACATQALLSVLMNADVELGEMLSDFKGFAGVLDSESMGITIGNHDGIRSVHNSFSRPEPFVMDDEDKKRNKGKEQDVFHFVAYVPFGGVLYEVDGLKPGPIHLGEIGAGQAWWDVARCVHACVCVCVCACVSIYVCLSLYDCVLVYLSHTLTLPPSTHACLNLQACNRGAHGGSQ